MHLAFQAAALLSDLKDAERLEHLKHEFCQLCKLFPVKHLIYKHRPAYNPTPSLLQQCHEKGEFKKHKDHYTEKVSVRWSFFLHPFIPIRGFAHILWTNASAEHAQTLTPKKPKAQGGRDMQTHTYPDLYRQQRKKFSHLVCELQNIEFSLQMAQGFASLKKKKP